MGARRRHRRNEWPILSTIGSRPSCLNRATTPVSSPRPCISGCRASSPSGYKRASKPSAAAVAVSSPTRRYSSPPKRALLRPFAWCATTKPCNTCASPAFSPAVRAQATPGASSLPPWTASVVPKPSRPHSACKHKTTFSTFARGERIIPEGKVRSSRAFFVARRWVVCFRSIAIFSPWASVLFRFAGLPLGFPYLFLLGRLVSSSRFFFPPCSVAGNRLCLPGEKIRFATSLARAPCARAFRVLNNCFYLFTKCAQLLEIECFAVKVNCRVLHFTFLSDRCKSLSFSKIR